MINRMIFSSLSSIRRAWKEISLSVAIGVYLGAYLVIWWADS